MAKRARQVIIQGDVTGDIGNVIISGNSGPVHVGDGDIIIDRTDRTDRPAGGTTTVITGPGAVIVRGDNHGGVRKSFGKKKGR